MTDESDQIPPSTRKTRSRRKRPRDTVEATMADRPDVASNLNPGPGRTRILDPDQATLDENLRRLYGAASVQAPLEEMAACVGASLDTLREFFRRYPTVKEKCDDFRRTGITTILGQLFKNLSRDPKTAMWMADRMGGIKDPYKLQDFNLRERALARQREEFEQTMELEKLRHAQRERELLMKEDEIARKKKDIGPGLPIDIKALSLSQLLQLVARIKVATAHNDVSPSLTFDDVNSRPDKH